MKKFLLLAAIITSLMINVYGQSWYVAASSGLSIREKPGAKAAVVGKIADTYPEEIVTITTEGIVGAWAATTYAGKTGYIVNSYLFPYPPPKKNNV
jgi:hypothetical protein